MKYILLILLGLTGCSDVTEPADWDAAERWCSNHNGIRWVDPSINLHVRCNDNVLVKGVRPK